MTVPPGIRRGLLKEHGLPTGSTLEDRVTWRLYRAGLLDKFQYQVGRYRLDYAWPAVKIALEVDGPHHWQPDMALRDVNRNAYLRDEGWLIFQIDDKNCSLEEQLSRVIGVIRREINPGAIDLEGYQKDMAKVAAYLRSRRSRKAFTHGSPRTWLRMDAREQ